MLDSFQIIRSRTARPGISIPLSIYLFSVYLASCIAPCLAQERATLEWNFTSNLLSTTLPTCLPLAITIKSGDNIIQGVPPYYMIAFGMGERTVTTPIGTDVTSLSWTVTHPIGSALLLSVVDAQGNSSGIFPQIMQVIAGPTQTCTYPKTIGGGINDFVVTVDVTDVLQTCQPWGFTMKGGVPPYILTLASPESQINFNTTLPYHDNAFTYINRADPGSQLIGAVSDSTGKWATTDTQIVGTQGSRNVDCTGLVSTSRYVTFNPQLSQPATAAPKRSKSIIIGICTTLALLVLVGLGVVTFLWMRRRQQRKQKTVTLAPHPFIEVEKRHDQVFSTNSDLEPSRIIGPSALAVTSASHTSSCPQSSTPPILFPSNSDPIHVTRPTTNANAQPSTSGTTVILTTSIQGHRTATEGGRTNQLPEVEHPGSVLLPMDSAEVEGGIVFQHRDGGRIVHELPPPYLDPRGPGHSSPS